MKERGRFEELQFWVLLLIILVTIVFFILGFISEEKKREEFFKKDPNGYCSRYQSARVGSFEARCVKYLDIPG